MLQPHAGQMSTFVPTRWADHPWATVLPPAGSSSSTLWVMNLRSMAVQTTYEGCFASLCQGTRLSDQFLRLPASEHVQVCQPDATIIVGNVIENKKSCVHIQFHFDCQTEDKWNPRHCLQGLWLCFDLFHCFLAETRGQTLLMVMYFNSRFAIYCVKNSQKL